MATGDPQLADVNVADEAASDADDEPAWFNWLISVGLGGAIAGLILMIAGAATGQHLVAKVGITLFLVAFAEAGLGGSVGGIVGLARRDWRSGLVMLGVGLLFIAATVAFLLNVWFGLGGGDDGGGAD